MESGDREARVGPRSSGFRDLESWQVGIQLAKAVYQFTSEFPGHEQYGLTSQLRRAAISVPANLAEGHSRNSTKDYLRFVSIARGSVAEVETLLVLSKELEFGSPNMLEDLQTRFDRLARMLFGLEKALKRKLH